MNLGKAAGRAALAMVFAVGLRAFAADEITGTVTDTAGKPVPDAQVYVCGQGDTFFHYKKLAEGRCGEDGAFRISLPQGLPAERDYYVISAHKEGFAWGQNYFDTDAPKAAALILEKPASATGRVTDKQGAPIAGAHVYLSATKMAARNIFVNVGTLRGVAGMDMLTAQTDKDGAFTINDIPDGANCHFLVEAEGYATYFPLLRGSSQGPTAPAHDVAITLSPESRIRGILKREKDGAPVAGISLLLLAQRIPSTAGPTDAEGRFEARALAAGDYSATAYSRSSDDKDLGGLVAAMPPIHLDEGETKENVALTWTEGVVLEGKVLNAETREPVQGVSVGVYPVNRADGAYGSSGNTDSAGAYRLRALAGNYNVYINKENYERTNDQTVTLTAGSQTQDFTIKPVALTKLTVVDETGKPLAKATVQRWGQILATTDDKGQAQFSLPPPQGPSPLERIYIVSASGDLAAVLEHRGEEAKELTVTLKKTATLTGVVRKPDGSPLAGAIVRAWWRTVNMSGPEGAEVGTDADGKYKVNGLIGGVSYAVQAKAKGYGSNDYRNMKQITAEAGTMAEMEPITLDIASAMISGRVTDASGAPLEGVEIRLNSQRNNRPEPTATDKDGRFKIEDLVPEKVWLYGNNVQTGRNVFARNVAPEEFTDLKIVVYPEFDANRQAAANAPAPGLKELDWVQGEWKGFAGKRTVVAFVSIKNRVSRAVIKDAQTAVNGAKDGSLQAVLVHDATATPDEIKEFLARNQVTLPIGRVKVEENSGLYAPAFAAYSVSGVPTVVIVNAQGKIEAANVRPSELSSKLAGQTN